MFLGILLMAPVVAMLALSFTGNLDTGWMRWPVMIAIFLEIAFFAAANQDDPQG